MIRITIKSLSLSERTHRLIKEIKEEEVYAILHSKSTKKLIFSYLTQINKENRESGYPPYWYRSSKDIPVVNYDDWLVDEGNVEEVLSDIERRINDSVPPHLSINQKGLAANWMRVTMFKSIANFVSWMTFVSIQENRKEKIRAHKTNLLPRLRSYFEMQSFIPKQYQDIMNIPSATELELIIEQVKPQYDAYLEKKMFLDAKKGTERIGNITVSNKQYDVFIVHNKGAACQLGKETKWCTAAPGLSHYEEKYNDPKDPLFIFINSTNPQEKYQFNYGKREFANRENHTISVDLSELFTTQLLSLPGIIERYPIVAKYAQMHGMISNND